MCVWEEGGSGLGHFIQLAGACDRQHEMMLPIPPQYSLYGHRLAGLKVRCVCNQWSVPPVRS